MEEFIKSLNELAISFETKDKEIVDHLTCIKAYYYISHLTLDNQINILMYCVSMNLINSYVKQEDSLSHSYAFKCSIFKLLEEIKGKNVEGLKIAYLIDKGCPLLVVQIYDIQFSFHSVAKRAKELIPGAYLTDIAWDKVRKQKCPISLFNAVEEKLPKDNKNSAEKFISFHTANKKSFYNAISKCRFPKYCYKKTNN